MNASCHIPARSKIPLGLAMSNGALLLFDDTSGVQILATVLASKHIERDTTTSRSNTDDCVIVAFARS